jgi:hypothetical protein
MRTFNFLLLAMLSCIAMIGAVSIGNRAPAEVINRDQIGNYARKYVPWQQLMGVLTRLKKNSPALVDSQESTKFPLNFSPPR